MATRTPTLPETAIPESAPAQAVPARRQRWNVHGHDADVFLLSELPITPRPIRTPEHPDVAQLRVLLERAEKLYHEIDMCTQIIDRRTERNQRSAQIQERVWAQRALREVALQEVERERVALMSVLCQSEDDTVRLEAARIMSRHLRILTPRWIGNVMPVGL